MSRTITALVQVALLLSILSAILQSIRMILQQSVGVGSWYWAGALAVFLAPVALSLTLFILGRTNTARAIDAQPSGGTK